jgi:hypothetical protein
MYFSIHCTSKFRFADIRLCGGPRCPLSTGITSSSLPQALQVLGFMPSIVSAICTQSILAIRLFIDESELPKPDLSRLLTNPYEGLDSEDVEIIEQQKNIEVFKSYLETDESNKWNFLCSDNLDGTEKMFDTLNELYNKKARNTVCSK